MGRIHLHGWWGGLHACDIYAIFTPEEWGQVAQGLGAMSGIHSSHRWQVAGRGWHMPRSIQVVPPTLTQNPARSQHVAAEQHKQFAPPSSPLLNLLMIRRHVLTINAVTGTLLQKAAAPTHAIPLKNRVYSRIK